MPASTPTAATATPLDDRLVGFARALRGHGLATGTSEVIDAGAVMTVLGLEDRTRLREGLAAALIRRSGERRVFDDLFDVWFPAALGVRLGTADRERATTPEEQRARAADLRVELAAALALGDTHALELLAARAVAELGLLQNAGTTGSWSPRQTIDALAPQTAIAGALARIGGPPSGARFADRFTRDELRTEVARFARRIEAETRRRNAEIRGADRIGRYAVHAPTELTPFLLAGRTDLEELRRTVEPLARKLATRIAARRRHASRGSIDVRATLRRSLGTGGVPVRPAYRHRRPARTQLVLICDLSQSVAGFSRFTILLMQALAAQFTRLRIFGFVNVCAELTDAVVGAPPGSDLGPVFDDTRGMTRGHHNSDYGTALADFVEHHLDAVGPRTVVLILGDARTNGTNPRLDALHEIAERARAVAWLNPEPGRQWSSGDSVAHRYAEVVDMHEVGNLAQLRAFVTRLLPV